MTSASCDILLPREVIERILFYCDGQTLRSAQFVNKEWKDIVEYLDKKYHIWRRSCVEDFPKLEVFQYEAQFTSDWQSIYENRISWQDIKQNIEFQIDVFEYDKDTFEIAGVAIADIFIAIADFSGNLMVYDENGILYKTFEPCEARTVKSLHFVTDDMGQPTFVIQNYGNMMTAHCLFEDIYRLEGWGGLTVDSYWTTDVYKNFFCGFDRGCYVNTFNIARFTIRDNMFTYNVSASVSVPTRANPLRGLEETCMLSENLCLLLENNEVYLVERCHPQSQFVVRRLITLTGSDDPFFHEYWVWNKDVVLASFAEHHKEPPQVIHLYIIKQDDKHLTKYFLPQKIFETTITSVRLYGNTLVIGTLTGSLYFYELNNHHDWEVFDIANYSHKVEDMLFGPVKFITAVEKHGKRMFYVISAWNKVRIISGIKWPPYAHQGQVQ